MTLGVALAYGVVLWALGTSVGSLGGLRPVTAVLSGLPFAATIVACVGLAQTWFDFAFDPLSVSAGFGSALLVAGVIRALLLSRSLRHGPTQRHGGDTGKRYAGPRAAVALSAGLLGWIVLSLVVMASVAGRDLETVSQTWDAIFDANAVRFGFETANLAPGHITSFSFPGDVGASYPTGFHALAVLFMQVAGTDAVVATNVVAAFIAGGLWPSSVVLGARLMLGPSRTVTWSSLALAWACHAMPWGPMGWGVLWATAGAAAFGPLVLASAAAVLRITKERLALPQAIPLALASAAACAIFHPRVLLLNLHVVLGLWLCAFSWRCIQLFRSRRRGQAVVCGLLALAPLPFFTAMVLFVGRDSGATRARIWPVDRPLWSEIAQHVVNGPIGTIPQLIPAGLAALAAWSWWRRPEVIWSAILLLGTWILDIGTAVLQGVVFFNGIARFWYNDRHRTLTLIAFPLILLAVLGVERLLEVLARPQPFPALSPRATMSGAAVAVIVVAWGGWAAHDRLDVTYGSASTDPEASVVSPQERLFFKDIAQVVPESDLILNNANDGSALIYAYENRRPVFMVAGTRSSTQYGLSLRNTLIDLPYGDLCSALREDRIRWVLNNGEAFHADVIIKEDAPKMLIPRGHWAFTPEVEMGDRVLYRVSGCAAAGW